MKTTHARPRAARDPKKSGPRNYEQALKACEAAAARIQSASQELAAGWNALCREISAGGPPTELLRKRAWCNVLELRLKEQAHALEQARQDMDRVWEDLMLTARARELFHRFVRKGAGTEFVRRESIPLLIRTATALAAQHAGLVPIKK
ncbi:MAG: hypothetical protein U1F98_08015 [Verrucomicrobiota bacterium]